VEKLSDVVGLYLTPGTPWSSAQGDAGAAEVLGDSPDVQRRVAAQAQDWGRDAYAEDHSGVPSSLFVFE
jgi:hypothetical protein